MNIESQICMLCDNAPGCDRNLTFQLVSKGGNVITINSEDEQRFSCINCRHWACVRKNGGIEAAQKAMKNGKFELILTPDGLVEAANFWTKDKPTLKLRYVTRDGVIYSCETPGGMFYRTGQRIEASGIIHY